MARIVASAIGRYYHVRYAFMLPSSNIKILPGSSIIISFYWTRWMSSASALLLLTMSWMPTI